MIKLTPVAVAGTLFAALCLCAQKYIFWPDVKDPVCSTSVTFEDCLSEMATNIWLYEDSAQQNTSQGIGGHLPKYWWT